MGWYISNPELISILHEIVHNNGRIHGFMNGSLSYILDIIHQNMKEPYKENELSDVCQPDSIERGSDPVSIGKYRIH